LRSQNYRDNIDAYITRILGTRWHGELTVPRINAFYKHYGTTAGGKATATTECTGTGSLVSQTGTVRGQRQPISRGPAERTTTLLAKPCADTGAAECQANTLPD
jgi:hypothetical protein